MTKMNRVDLYIGGLPESYPIFLPGDARAVLPENVPIPWRSISRSSEIETGTLETTGENEIRFKDVGNILKPEPVQDSVQDVFLVANLTKLRIDTDQGFRSLTSWVPELMLLDDQGHQAALCVQRLGVTKSSLSRRPEFEGLQVFPVPSSNMTLIVSPEIGDRIEKALPDIHAAKVDMLYVRKGFDGHEGFMESGEEGSMNPATDKLEADRNEPGF